MCDYNLLTQAIMDGDADKVADMTSSALKEGYPAQNILENALIFGMNKVAEKFKHERVLVPEVLLATRAMHAGLAVLSPYLKKNRVKSKCKIVIGTVEGDLHDIGKYLVIIILSTIGLEVIDLGVNVSPKAFVNAVRKEKPDILMMSALLTTTMPVMKTVISELEDKGLRSKVKVFIGGTPVTDMFSRKIGADYYFQDMFELRNFMEENVNKLLVK